MPNVVSLESFPNFSSTISFIRFNICHKTILFI
jgi:hypothetical protein